MDAARNGSFWPIAPYPQIVGQRDDSAWSRAVRLSGQLIRDFAISLFVTSLRFGMVSPKVVYRVAESVACPEEVIVVAGPAVRLDLEALLVIK